jgi:hypothetical protein
MSRMVQKKMDLQTRDIPFRITTNEQMIAALSGDPG